MLFLIIFLLIIAVSIYLNSAQGKGKIGEKVVAHKIEKLNSEEYHVVNNVMLKSNGITSQIDHVVISRYGIFVIETKNYEGWIFGSENSEFWTQNIYGNKYRLRNPIKQNHGHVIAIKEFLKEYPNLKVIPIVAFSNKATLKVNNIKSHLTYYRGINNIIHSYTEVVLSDEDISYITKRFSHYSDVSKEELKAHISQINQNLREKEERIRSGKCPQCGGTLVLRHGRYGYFYGCSNYPHCRYTRKIN